MPCARALRQRVEGEARRVGALLARDDARAGALAPDLQLLDRGGAERVAGGEHDRPCLRRANLAASLPMVVVLPEPLTPTTRITNGFFAGVDRERVARPASSTRLDLAGEDRA